MSTIATQQRSYRAPTGWIALLMIVAATLGAATLAVVQTVTSTDEVRGTATVIPFVDAAIQGRSLNEQAATSSVGSSSFDPAAIGHAKALNSPPIAARSTFNLTALQAARILNEPGSTGKPTFSLKASMDLRSLNR